MHKIKMVASLVIPILVGIFIYFAATSGLFKRWELLTTPSEYDLSYFSAAKKPDGFPESIQACDYSMVEFTIFSNKPKNISECVQSIRIFADGDGRVTLVRDSDGNVWEWDFARIAYNELGALCWPIIFLIIGIFIMKAVKDPTKPIGQ